MCSVIHSRKLASVIALFLWCKFCDELTFHIIKCLHVCTVFYSFSSLWQPLLITKERAARLLLLNYARSLEVTFDDGNHLQFFFMLTIFLNILLIIVLYIWIIKVWGFLPPTNQPNINFVTVWQHWLGIAKPKMLSDQP